MSRHFPDSPKANVVEAPDSLISSEMWASKPLKESENNCAKIKFHGQQVAAESLTCKMHLKMNATAPNARYTLWELGRKPDDSIGPRRAPVLVGTPNC